MKSAILLSGGMDSIALAYWIRPHVAYTIDYGQKPAEAEIRSAAAVSKTLGIEHHVLECDLSAFGSGDLAGTGALDCAPVREWWPFRNQALVTIAAMRGLRDQISELVIGCLSTDGEHVDGTSKFVEGLSSLLQMQEGSLKLVAPAINHTAATLIYDSKVPPDILSYAHSCHVSSFACGVCRGCYKHYHTLKELGFAAY